MGSRTSRAVVEARAAELAAELVTEPVMGWRAWRLEPSEGGYLLRSLAQDARPWPPREALRAACLRGVSHGPAPAMPCRCGVYAWKRLSDLDVGRWARGSVLGTVALWGRIVEHEHGYRAEWAYPQRVRLVCARCLTNGSPSEGRVAGVFHATGWSVPASGGELVALCEHHGGPLVDDMAEAAPVELALLDAYAVDLLPEEALLGSADPPPEPPDPGPGLRGLLARLSRRLLTA